MHDEFNGTGWVEDHEDLEMVYDAHMGQMMVMESDGVLKPLAPASTRPLKPVLFEWDGKPVVEVAEDMARDCFMLRFQDGKKMMLDRWTAQHELRSLIEPSHDPEVFRGQVEVDRVLGSRRAWRKEQERVVRELEESTAKNKALLATMQAPEPKVTRIKWYHGLAAPPKPKPSTITGLEPGSYFSSPGYYPPRLPTPKASITEADRAFLAVLSPEEPPAPPPREPFRTFIIAKHGFSGYRNPRTRQAA